MEGELRVDELIAAETLVKGSKNRIILCSTVPTEKIMSLQTGCMVVYVRQLTYPNLCCKAWSWTVGYPCQSP